MKREKVKIMKCYIWEITSVCNVLYPSKMAPLHSVNFVKEYIGTISCHKQMLFIMVCLTSTVLLW